MLSLVTVILSTCSERKELYIDVGCCSENAEKAIQGEGVLRTPETNFETVDFYEPKYVTTTYADIPFRVAYYDIGPTQSEYTILVMHGTPTWSYLYRKMIPIVAGAGYRVIAIDNPGAGRSDKLAIWQEYSPSSFRIFFFCCGREGYISSPFCRNGAKTSTRISRVALAHF